MKEHKAGYLRGGEVLHVLNRHSRKLSGRDQKFPTSTTSTLEINKAKYTDKYLYPNNTQLAVFKNNKYPIGELTTE